MAEIDEVIEGYYSDAGWVRKNPKNVQLLLETVKRMVGDTTAERRAFYERLHPFLDDFDLLSSLDGETAAAKLNYVYNITKRKNVNWGVAVLLAWLCYASNNEAEYFYRTAGIRTTDGEFRKYLGTPGQWGDQRRREKAQGNTSLRTHPPLKSGLDLIKPKKFESLRDKQAFNSTEEAIQFRHLDGICFADFSSDGKFIAVGGKVGEEKAGLFKWDIQDIESISVEDRCVRLATFENDVLSVSVSPDSQYVVAASESEARVFSSYAVNREPLRKLRHRKQISYCSFSPDGTKIATASHDQTACIWEMSSVSDDPITIITIKMKRGHVVNSAYFSPDGNYLLLACSNCTISEWCVQDPKNPKFIADYVAEEADWVCGALYSKDGKKILSAGPGSGCAYIWEVDQERRATRERMGEQLAPTVVEKRPPIILGGDDAHSDTIWSAEYSPNGGYVITASEDRFAFIWDVDKRTIKNRLKHPAPLYAAHFSQDGKYVLTACDNGSVYLWKFRN